MDPTPKKDTFPYYSEYVYAIAETRITGAAAKRPGGRKIKHGLEAIAREMVRDPAYCPHIDVVRPPVVLHGLEPAQLLERLRYLEDASAQMTETYAIDGVQHTRRQRKNTPVALVGVASYPGPVTAPTPDRDRWQELVIEALVTRFGEKLKAVYAHVDESCYHLHAWVDDDGRPAKKLCPGFEAEEEARLAGKTRKEQQAAYRTAMSELQDSFYEAVGEPMGWVRRRPSPKPRAPRVQALIEKQQRLAAVEEQQAAERKRLYEEDLEQIERIRIIEAKMRELQEREVAMQAQYEQWRQRKEASRNQLREAAQILFDAGKTFSADERRVIENALRAQLQLRPRGYLDTIPF